MQRKYPLPIFRLELKKGSIFPDFNLLDDKGDPYSLKDNFKNNYLLLYFYPKDETPGCTKQACYFRDFNSEFTDLNCDIIGLSSDGKNNHENFKKKYNLPFKLLTDYKSHLRNKLNLPKDFLGLSAGRVTFIINSKYEILFIYRSSLNMKSHITNSLNFLKSL